LIRPKLLGTSPSLAEPRPMGSSCTQGNLPKSWSRLTTLGLGQDCHLRRWIGVG